MATEKVIQSRLVNKHDVEVNWNRAKTFVPKAGEIIVYDIDDTYSYERFKLGDGKTVVGELPFYLENELNNALEQMKYLASQVPEHEYANGTLFIRKGITFPSAQ